MIAKTIRIALLIDEAGIWSANGVSALDGGECDPDWEWMHEQLDLTDSKALRSRARYWVTVTVEVPVQRNVDGQAEEVEG